MRAEARVGEAREVISMTEPSDQEQLLQRAITGDRISAQELLLFHHDRLTATIAAKLPSELKGAISAEDICQEAYVSALRAIESFKPSDNKDTFFAWLRTIGDRKLTDAVRARRAAKRGGQKVEGGSPADSSSVIAMLDLLAVHERTPSRSLARREAILAIQAEFVRLPEDYRTVLHLRYLEGLSVTETAERMARSEGAVKMALQSRDQGARRANRQHLALTEPHLAPRV